MKPTLRDQYMMHALAGYIADQYVIIDDEHRPRIVSAVIKLVDEATAQACRHWGHAWDEQDFRICERCGFEKGSDR